MAFQEDPGFRTRLNRLEALPLVFGAAIMLVMCGFCVYQIAF